VSELIDFIDRRMNPINPIDPTQTTESEWINVPSVLMDCQPCLSITLASLFFESSSEVVEGSLQKDRPEP
jgi:hypothetical protein